MPGLVSFGAHKHGAFIQGQRKKIAHCQGQVGFYPESLWHVPDIPWRRVTVVVPAMKTNHAFEGNFAQKHL
jgi:hypothetical protein